ncbi:MAG: Flp pilus assembly complex ATPase component TadA [Oligoflexia bacterium]|nr:Flp pilus assembly complex ATPase component TadA [Oligoflexia bacterium]
MNTEKELDKKISVALGELADLFNNKDVTEILVDGPGRVWYASAGKIYDVPELLKSVNDVKKVVDNILRLFEKEINQQITTYEFNIGENARFYAVLPPSVVGISPVFGIVKRPAKNLTWDDLLKYKSMDENVIKILQKIINTPKKAKILLAAGIGSGVTHIFNLCVNTVSDTKRVIVAERIHETIIEHKRAILLESKNNEENEFTKMINFSLTMRPDFVAIHLIDNANQTIEALNVMRSIDALISIVPTEGIFDALKRIELNMLAGNLSLGVDDIKNIIASGIKYVCYQQRFLDGRRKLTEIVRLDGVENGRYVVTPIIHWGAEKDEWVVSEEGEKLLND